jgi:hypothetical protein
VVLRGFGFDEADSRGGAVKNLADSCATNFERELSQRQSHIRIVDQPTSARSVTRAVGSAVSRVTAAATDRAQASASAIAPLFSF